MSANHLFLKSVALLTLGLQINLIILLKSYFISTYLGLLYPQNITMIQAIQRIPWDHRIGNLYWVYHPRQLPNYKSTNQRVVGWSVNNPGSWVSTRVQRRSMPYEVYYHYHCLNPHQPHYFINLKDQLITELVISPKVEKSSLGEWSRKEEIRQPNLMKLLVSSITYSSC